MRKLPWGIAVIVGLALLSVFSFSAIYLTAPTHGPDLARSKPTENKLFIATIAPQDGEPTVGPLSTWTLTLRYPNGHPVLDAKVAVDGGMPDHDHGLPTRPSVSADLGEGHYRVDGLKFSMPGLWVLKFAISTADGADEASFNLKL